MFPVEEKLFSSLMRIPSGILGTGEIDEISTIVSFAYLSNLFFET